MDGNKRKIEVQTSTSNNSKNHEWIVADTKLTGVPTITATPTNKKCKRYDQGDHSSIPDEVTFEQLQIMKQYDELQAEEQQQRAIQHMEQYDYEQRQEMKYLLLLQQHDNNNDLSIQEQIIKQDDELKAEKEEQRAIQQMEQYAYEQEQELKYLQQQQQHDDDDHDGLWIQKQNDVTTQIQDTKSENGQNMGPHENESNNENEEYEWLVLESQENVFEDALFEQAQYQHKQQSLKYLEDEAFEFTYLSYDDDDELCMQEEEEQQQVSFEPEYYWEEEQHVQILKGKFAMANENLNILPESLKLALLREANLITRTL